MMVHPILDFPEAQTNSKNSVSEIEHIIYESHSLLFDCPPPPDTLEIPITALRHLPASRNVIELLRNLHMICNHLHILRDPSHIQCDDYIVSLPIHLHIAHGV